MAGSEIHVAPAIRASHSSTAGHDASPAATASGRTPRMVDWIALPRCSRIAEVVRGVDVEVHAYRENSQGFIGLFQRNGRNLHHAVAYSGKAAAARGDSGHVQRDKLPARARDSRDGLAMRSIDSQKIEAHALAELTKLIFHRLKRRGEPFSVRSNSTPAFSEAFSPAICRKRLS